MHYVKELFSEDIAILFEKCLITTYFIIKGKLYEQTKHVAMGNPFLKQKMWYWNVDDTFVISTIFTVTTSL